MTVHKIIGIFYSTLNTMTRIFFSGLSKIALAVFTVNVSINTHKNLLEH